MAYWAGTIARGLVAGRSDEELPKGKECPGQEGLNADEPEQEPADFLLKACLNALQAGTNPRNFHP